MKKLFILIAFALTLTLASCTNYETTGTVHSAEAEFTVLYVDSCEYLFRRYNEGCMFSHKGNCRNPIHKQSPVDTIYVPKYVLISKDTLK
jgi:hypothetical protein